MNIKTFLFDLLKRKPREGDKAMMYGKKMPVKKTAKPVKKTAKKK